jgi:hypothetical protein
MEVNVMKFRHAKALRTTDVLVMFTLISCDIRAGGPDM